MMTSAGVTHIPVCGGYLGLISFTCGGCLSSSSSWRLRSNSCLRFGRRHAFTVRPVTQCRHADPYSQDDQSQEEEKPGGGVEAELSSHNHYISASFPLSE